MARKRKTADFEAAMTFEAPPAEFRPGAQVRNTAGVEGTYRNKLKKAPYHFVSANGMLATWPDGDFQEVSA